MKLYDVEIPKEDVLAILEGMRLMDDPFMELCFTDAPEVVELVLRIVLSMPGLCVEKVMTQAKVTGIGKRGVCFDVLAYDTDGVWYNIEIQKDVRGASPKRSRYYSSMLDVHLSEAGEEFDELPRAVVVFITETDTLGYGEAVSVFERRDNNGRKLCDGSSIVYVNGAWKGDDDIGRLMADFKERDARKMHYEVLKNRTQSIKDPIVVDFKEGNMSEEINAILSKYDSARIAAAQNEGMAKGIAKGMAKGMAKKATATARAMLEHNLDVNMVAECTLLPLEEVMKLLSERVKPLEAKSAQE